MVLVAQTLEEDFFAMVWFWVTASWLAPTRLLVRCGRTLTVRLAF